MFGDNPLDTSVVTPQDPDTRLVRGVHRFTSDGRMTGQVSNVEHPDLMVTGYSRSEFLRKFSSHRNREWSTHIREEKGNICALNIFALWPVRITDWQTKG